MSARMRVGMLVEMGRVAIQEAARPAPGPGEVLIRVAYAGVCGSDVHAFRGTHPFRHPPVVLGHEVSGRIAALGAGVAGPAEGDAVTVMPYVACGRCPACLRGRTNVCENKVVPGLGGWLGTFADYFVAPADVTFPLVAGISLPQGALAEPLAVGVHSVAQGRVGAGESVLVLGGGTIGLLTAYAARRRGAAVVALTDLYDHNLAVARTLGATDTYSARNADVQARIGADHPAGFDVIVLAGAAPVIVDQAFGLAARGARIVSTALFHGPLPVDLVTLTLSEMELIGTQIYLPGDFQLALDWLREDGPRLVHIVDRVMPLEQAQEAMLILAEHREDAIKILLTPELD